MKVGDCVNLRTGGCLMTVKHVGYEFGTVLCIWFDENLEFHEDVFLLPDLVRWVQA